MNKFLKGLAKAAGIAQMVSAAIAFKNPALSAGISTVVGIIQTQLPPAVEKKDDQQSIAPRNY